MPPNRLPIVDSDDGVWGDILRQYLMQEHVNDDTDNPLNGGHKTITIQPGTTAAGTAPLKFSSGSLLTTPEAGAIEFLSDTLYFTDSSGPTRRAIATYPVSGGAEGDIYYRNSSGAFTRLGIGSNGEVLTVTGGIPAWSSTGVASKLDSADFTTKVREGSNFVVNSDFEDTTVGRTNYGNPISPGYSTEQSRSGSNSWKWTTPTLGNTSGLQFDLSDNNISTNVTARVQSGDKFYISAWIYAHAGNSHGAGGAIQLTARFSDSKGVLSNSYQSETINLSSLSVSTWTKLHVSLDAPNGYDRLVVYVTANNAVPQNNIYYVDDLVWQPVSTYRQGGALELFNTKDEETNYEKARHYWSGNTYTIATEKGGTGAERPMQIIGSGTTLGFATNGNSAAVISRNATQASVLLEVASTGLTKTSGNQAGISINPTINQSGTASYTGLLVNPTESSTGSGTKLLADFQLGGVSMASISTTGVISAAAGTASTNVVTVGGTQTLTNKTINASNNTLSNIAVSHFAASAIVTESEGIASNDNDTTIPTSAAVKDYVDVTLSPTFQDNTFTLQDNSDTTKQARFELSGITTSTTRTFTLPDSNTTLVGTGAVQTLTNKTLTSPRVNNILDTNGATILNFSATASADNYLTVANGNATWVGMQANGASASIPIYMYPKGGGAFTVYTSSGYTPTIQANGQDTNLNLNLTSKGTGTVQANGVDVVTTTGTQTLTNKTLTTPRIATIRDANGNTLINSIPTASAVNYITVRNSASGEGAVSIDADGADTNVSMIFRSKGSGTFFFTVPTGQTPTIRAAGADTNHNLNLLSKGTGVVQANGIEVATISGAQTLTNKTLTTPRMNQILDTVGNVVLNFGAIGNANYLEMYNQSTGNPPQLRSAGSDTDIDLWLVPKGAGVLRVYASAGNTPTIRAHGADTNNNLNLVPRGSGVVQVDGVEAATISSTQTLTNKTINASNNTLSNIAVSHMASSAIVTESEGINSSDNDTSVPTTAAVKDYVDTKPPLTWTEVTGTSQTASVNRGYITNNVGLVTITLPTTAAAGDTVKITGKGAGGWRVAQNSGETIHFGDQDTTTGTGGRLDSTNRYDCVELVCITANNDWVVASSVGNIGMT